MLKNAYLKISIITPVYNQVNYIEATIQSVLSQHYANLEYIIVDGGSTDGTLDIIKKYEGIITTWISEPDNGMYDALNKGFEISTGEIMGWINADDIILPGALHKISLLFNQLPCINWIQGLNSTIDLNGNVLGSNVPKKFSLLKFLNYRYMWIQQESTFWRRCLWNQVGAQLNSELKFAGDFDLWFRFSQKEKLYNTDFLIGAWRKRPGQLSELYKDKYISEVNGVIDGYFKSHEQIQVLKKINFLQTLDTYIDKIKIFNFNILGKKIDKLYNIHKTDIYFCPISKSFKVT